MKSAFALAIVFAALLAGCGKPEDKFVGKWIGGVEMPPEAIEMIKGLAAMAPPDQRSKIDNIEEELKKVKFDVELKKDGTYTFAVSGSANSSTQTGTWTLSEDGKTVTLGAPKMSDADKTKAKSAGISDAMLAQAEGQAMAFKVTDEAAKSMVCEQTQMGMTTKITLTR